MTLSLELIICLKFTNERNVIIQFTEKIGKFKT